MIIYEDQTQITENLILLLHTVYGMLCLLLVQLEELPTLSPAAAGQEAAAVVRQWVEEKWFMATQVFYPPMPCPCHRQGMDLGRGEGWWAMGMRSG